MKYQDVVERMPNESLIYENVTNEELSLISVSIYQLETEPNSGIFYVGTNSEIPELTNKIMQPNTNMSFN
jgi:hypothetical protein